MIDAIGRGGRADAARRPHRRRPPPHGAHAGRRGRRRVRWRAPRSSASTCATTRACTPGSAWSTWCRSSPSTGRRSPTPSRRGTTSAPGRRPSSACRASSTARSARCPTSAGGAFTDLAPDCGPAAPHPTAGAVRRRRPAGARRLQRLAGRARPRRWPSASPAAPRRRRSGRSASQVGDRGAGVDEPGRPGRGRPGGRRRPDRPPAGAVAGCELVGLVPRRCSTRSHPDRWAELDLGADRTIEARLTSSGLG